MNNANMCSKIYFHVITRTSSLLRAPSTALARNSQGYEDKIWLKMFLNCNKKKHVYMKFGLLKKDEISWYIMWLKVIWSKPNYEVGHLCEHDIPYASQTPSHASLASTIHLSSPRQPTMWDKSGTTASNWCWNNWLVMKTLLWPDSILGEKIKSA